MKKILMSLLLGAFALSIAKASCDLPKAITDRLNGVPAPWLELDKEDPENNIYTGNLIMNAVPKPEVGVADYDSKSAKHHFFQAVGNLVLIVENPETIQLAKDLGYTYFTNPENSLDRKIQFEGRRNTTLTPNRVSSELVRSSEIFIDRALGELNQISESWEGTFNLGIELTISEQTFNFDNFAGIYVDQADIKMLKGALKSAKAVLYALNGMDLGDRCGALLDVLRVVRDTLLTRDHFDLGLFLVDFPQVLKKVRNLESLKNAQEPLIDGLNVVNEAFARMESRNDKKHHLIGIRGLNGNDDPTIPIPNSYFLRMNFFGENNLLANFVAALEGPISFDFHTFGWRYERMPNWVTGEPLNGKLTVDFAPFFNGKFIGPKVLPEFTEDGNIMPETIIDPTLGGIFPDMTMDCLMKAYAMLNRVEYWTLEGYCRYQVSLPYGDPTYTHVDKAKRIVEISGYFDSLSVKTDLTGASIGTKAQIVVDEKTPIFVDNTNPYNLVISDSDRGEHKITWIFTATEPQTEALCFISDDYSFETLYTQESEIQVPFSWLIQQGLVEQDETDRSVYEQAAKKSTIEKKNGCTYTVAEEYMLGTHPNNSDDYFHATMVPDLTGGSVPVPSWYPRLSALEEAKRLYTIWYKDDLRHLEWKKFTEAIEPSKCRFFKVSVEMKHDYKNNP